jgi:serine beta-lactamase-like protein LACTB
MTRRLLVALAATTALAGALAAITGASGSASAEAKPAGGCREWLVARDYGREIAAVRPLVLKMKRAFAAPGLGVAIGAGGKLVWSQTCGFANRERSLAVRRTTQFRIGSVSKTLTAVTAARLSQSARLDLDAQVQRYVPAFPRKAQPITLRQLGGHLAGIRHYESGEVMSARHYDSVTSSLAIFKSDPLVARPGERFSYSSYGFNLLGAAIEAAAGKPFAAAVEETVATPLGMRRTSVDDGRARSGRARFYEVTATRTAVPAPRVDLSDRYPSGGVLSTAEDLVRLGIGITDRAFATAKTQALLFTPQKTASGKPTGYGFGFEVGASPVGRIVGHTGNVVGGTAFLFVHPRTRVVVAMTTNVGFVTVANPPALGRDVPDPPRLAMPFIRRALKEGRGGR